MDLFGEVHLGSTLLDVCVGYFIVLVSLQVVRDEAT